MSECSFALGSYDKKLKSIEGEKRTAHVLGNIRLALCSTMYHIYHPSTTPDKTL